MKFYDEWMNNKNIPEKYKIELNGLPSEELNDRFYKELSFGTAGLRGKLGQGTNRMNIMTVARACQGIADTISLIGKHAMEKGVVIAYDIRHMSKEFAELSAKILSSNGIKVYLYDDFKTTPLLSFSILELKTQAGIMITASHNPKEYNGYKVYWENGAQISFEISDLISKKIKEVGDYGVFNIGELDNPNIIKLENEIEDKYLQVIENYDFYTDYDKDIKIVYTPLNGTGNLPVRKVLKETGFNNVSIVKEQEYPDSNFTSVGYPNPEDPKAFIQAEKLGKEINADLLIATDPDCDRIAIGIPKDENFIYPTGNKIGILMIDFLTSNMPKEILDNSFMVKSVVTGNLGKKLALSRGVDFYESLTGFKNICDKAIEIESLSNKKFLFGYEESIGFLYGSHARDKDAVISSKLISIIAGNLKIKGSDLNTRLNEIYSEFGYYRDLLIQRILEGEEGQKKFKAIMDNLRNFQIDNIGSLKVLEKIDFQKNSNLKLQTDLICFKIEGDSKLFVRPSGTEPKLKFYVESIGETMNEAKAVEEEINHFVKNL